MRKDDIDNLILKRDFDETFEHLILKLKKKTCRDWWKKSNWSYNFLHKTNKWSICKRLTYINKGIKKIFNKQI